VAVDRADAVNHFGPSFATMRPENVVLVDFSGRVLDGDACANDTIRLHGIIRRESPRASKGLGF